jgi:hypothetical protein
MMKRGIYKKKNLMKQICLKKGKLLKRAIMKKRKRFEYKMQRRTKEKDVYLQYIQYEIGVYQLIKLRREVYFFYKKNLGPFATLKYTLNLSRKSELSLEKMK